MNVTYHFGRFELDPVARRLFADGSPVHLGARAFDVLLALVERRDRLVTKDELLELAWPGLVVEENNLQVQTSALRKVLGPSSITTVPGLGYRFTARIDSVPTTQGEAVAPSENRSVVDEPTPPSDPEQATQGRSARAIRAIRAAAKARVSPRLALAAAMLVVVAVGGWVWSRREVPVEPVARTAETLALDRKAIAVLPFENLTGRAEDAYLADGLQEEVLNALARISDLKVISRTSVMEYRGKAYNVREIAKRLDVGTILEGAIRREGNTLRLTVQLVDARNDRHLLAANLDRDMAHMLDLQSTVARQVADSLSATLSRSERGELDRVTTNSGDAYDRYLQAVAVLQRQRPVPPERLVRSKRLLQEAIAFDPDYADAHALLSIVNTSSYVTKRLPEDATAAQQGFERALAIDPQLPEARLARGLYAMYVVLDPERALADLEPVVQLRPNSARAHEALGYALRRRGRMDQGQDHLVRAWELDPLNKRCAENALITLLGLRRYPEAIEQTGLMLRRFPDEPEPYITRAAIEWHLQRDIEPLRAALREHGSQLEPNLRRRVETAIAIAEGRYLDAARLQEGTYSDQAAQDPSGAQLTDTSLERAASAGLLYRAAGDEHRAEQIFRAAERDALDRAKREPGFAWDPVWLSVIQSMLGEHAAALATIDAARTKVPESRDAVNGPPRSFVRSIILVRAGRSDEGYAEVARLLRVPFGTPSWPHFGHPLLLLVRDDPHYDELLNRPPRL